MDMNGYQKLLAEYISFKSISTNPDYEPEIQKTVDWLKNLFSENGFRVEEWYQENANPYVFADYFQSDDLETILIYGHYDVQPANETDGWFADPFRVVEKDDRLYARGVVDNKGQNLIHIATVIELIKENKLTYNVKFLIEGNEETGQPIGPVIRSHQDEINCDYIIVSDGEISGNNPTIETSFRGGFNLTLKYKTADNTLHSGIFGGAVPNAAYELTKLLSKLYNENNELNIPGIYNNMDEITNEQVANNKQFISDDKEIMKLSTTKTLLKEPNTDFFTQTGLKPTIQITGLKAGYTDEGYANIVTDQAIAKLNFRIVTSQKPDQIKELFEKFVKKNSPDYVEYEITIGGAHDPVKIETSTEIFRKAAQELEKAFGKKVLYKPVGGAIPFIADMKNIMNKDTISASLGNEDCNMHGVNENYRIDLIEKGLDFSYRFFSS